jgi:catechol 2,3-dioxygenase-like lactoylglutathione lyase family enzyme
VFDHVTIRVADLAASTSFYEQVFAAIGKDRQAGEEFVEWGDWSIHAASAGRPPTRNLHVGFYVDSEDLVGAFWRAGLKAGARSDGEPGPRPVYGDDYYGAFLLDPDGNSVEAMLHDVDRREVGQVDHLWIRVADVAAARAFYLAVAPHAGLRLGTDAPERVQFRGEDFTFSLVADERSRTENVHVAFGAPDHAAVDAFHAAAIAAGHRDNGAPGERPEYHPGYYGAFVLDPDGNNIEAVDHGR